MIFVGLVETEINWRASSPTIEFSGCDLARYARSRTPTAVRSEGEIHVDDYGIIIRAPHWEHSGRLVLVIAGAHRLGTGAGCWRQHVHNSSERSN